jgi:hypothetical protein
LILLAVVLICVRSCQLEHQEERSIFAFQTAIDERVERVRASVDRLAIVDPALLSCVRGAAMDRAQIHPSSTGGIDDVSELQLLYCPGAGIYSLDGIGGLANLTFLDVSRNHIRTLTPLQRHPLLSALHVNDNPVEDLAVVRTLPSLQQVYLPDMPDEPCDRIERLVADVKSNIKAIDCKRQQARALAASPSASSSSNKRRDSPHELTEAQQDELLRFEQQSRYGNR